MAGIGRLNGIIRAWEEGRPAFASFANANRQTAIEFSTSPYDGVVFEMEHGSWDPGELQDSLQYLLNRKQIHAAPSLSPALTPVVRIPSNGVEMNQTYAKQALDRGVYGVVWPHIGTAEQAYNAVASCRYARKQTAEFYEPAGVRGDGPANACRYWGLTMPEYYKKADVWPLNPDGEILVITMIESVLGVQNLDDILKNVQGIGCCLIGEGDLSQALGYPRQYDHPEVKGAMKHIVETCKKYNVPVGHPHVTSGNVERVLAEGYRFILSAPVRSYDAIQKAKELTGKQVDSTVAEHAGHGEH
jgi:4-hydroxy-2-oxoheptanedioate aldolase